MLVVATVVLVAIVVLRVVVSTSSPIDPASYDPPSAPVLAGVLAVNRDLERAERIAEGMLVGGEDVALDGAGRIYAGAEDGRIVRVTRGQGGENDSIETFARTGGRPLGLAFDEAGDLIVADGIQGLLSIDPMGTVTLLTDRAEGEPFRFTDDLDIASNGKIYFSDASRRFGPDAYLYDLLEARPHGRLLVYDPDDGSTTVLKDGLYFANGIALSVAEDFVLVNETYRYRIQRCWIVGARAGECEVFVDNLPGFPDGVASDGRGTFWVAMYTVRNAAIDRLHPYPLLKRGLALLPKSLWPKPAPYGLVLAIDESGTITRSLHDPDAESVLGITSVEPHGDALYFGTLKHDWIGRYPLTSEVASP